MPKPVDTVASHLRNAQQILVGVPDLIQDDDREALKYAFEGIGDRIHDALALTEVDGKVIADIITAAANLETVAGNSDGSPMDELAATNIRARAERLRAFAATLL